MFLYSPSFIPLQMGLSLNLFICLIEITLLFFLKKDIVTGWVTVLPCLFILCETTGKNFRWRVNKIKKLEKSSQKVSYEYKSQFLKLVFFPSLLCLEVNPHIIKKKTLLTLNKIFYPFFLQVWFHVSVSKCFFYA